jgi:hypothetical protein
MISPYLKETIMDAIQRSEFNNQTSNGANEKWTPGSKGDTKDDGQPLDHSYPAGHGVQQLGSQSSRDMGTQQTGAGPGAADGQFDRSSGEGSTVPGGSMETQINGGSGPVQGITDSHQRQMEQKSSAYGELELPVGHRPKDTGVHLTRHHDMGRDELRGTLPSQSTAQPDLQGGSIGPRGGNLNLSTQGGGMHGPASSAQSGGNAGSMGNYQSASPSGTQGGGMAGPHTPGQEAQRGSMQQGVAGSRSASDQHSDSSGVHESNDVAGGLPRSPGNTGADHAASYDRAGSQTGPEGAERGPEVHESNDAAGGYPRSPGGANRLNGDQNMDDDTGFKRKS